MINKAKANLCAALTIGLLINLLPSSTSAGAWPQLQGEYYLKLWERTLIGSAAYTADGGRAGIGDTYQDHALNAYFEYGLTDEWTFVGFGRPVGFAEIAGNSAFYMGELNVGVRRSLTVNPVALALEAHYGFAPAVGDDVLATGSVEGGGTYVYSPTVTTHTVEGELQLGYSFHPGWVGLSVGTSWLTGDGLDPVLYGNANIGTAFDFGLVIGGYLALHQPFGDVVTTNVAGAGQTRFFGFGLDISYWLSEHIGINAGVGGAFLAESNASTPAIQLGLEMR